MRKPFILCLLSLVCVLLLAACAAQGPDVTYESDHTHVYGYWYDTVEQNVQVRYCRICQQSETQTLEPNE